MDTKDRLISVTTTSSEHHHCRNNKTHQQKGAMEYLQLCFCIVLVQQYISSALGMCDQRRFGGDLKCCDGKDSKCFVKVQSVRTKGQTNTICYCDSYCKFTNDCCEDYDTAQRLCRNPRDCHVSDWGTWSECNTDCGIGSMRRRRKVMKYPLNGGAACPTLKQTRGCNRDLCDKNNYATILPILYRRPSMYIYENILPASLEVQDPKESKPTSFCVHYRLTNKRRDCDKSWARSLESSTPVCVECQSRVMDNGHCRGEGAIGVRTRWKALGVQRCHGEWIRLGPVIPNCKCVEPQFSNFVFV